GADWPANEDELFHGIVVSKDPDILVVKSKDNKEHTFHRTKYVKVGRSEKKDDEKILQWNNVQDGDFVGLTYYKSKYFFDPLTDTEQEAFTRPEGYLSQIDQILRIVDPVDEKLNGTVQLGGWLYRRGALPGKTKWFTYVAESWKEEGDIRDEIWLAQ